MANLEFYSDDTFLNDDDFLNEDFLNEDEEYSEGDIFDEYEPELMGRRRKKRKKRRSKRKSARSKRKLKRFADRFLKKLKKKLRKKGKELTPALRKKIIKILFSPIPPLTKRLIIAKLVKAKAVKKGIKAANRTALAFATGGLSEAVRRARKRRQARQDDDSGYEKERVVKKYRRGRRVSKRSRPLTRAKASYRRRSDVLPQGPISTAPMPTEQQISVAPLPPTTSNPAMSLIVPLALGGVAAYLLTKKKK